MKDFPIQVSAAVRWKGKYHMGNTLPHVLQLINLSQGNHEQIQVTTSIQNHICDIKGMFLAMRHWTALHVTKYEEYVQHSQACPTGIAQP